MSGQVFSMVARKLLFGKVSGLRWIGPLGSVTMLGRWLLYRGCVVARIHSSDGVHGLLGVFHSSFSLFLCLVLVCVCVCVCVCV